MPQRRKVTIRIARAFSGKSDLYDNRRTGFPQESWSGDFCFVPENRLYSYLYEHSAAVFKKKTPGTPNVRAQYDFYKWLFGNEE